MNSVMEFVRYNLFATRAYATFHHFDVLSLVIPEGILVFTPASKQNNKTQNSFTANFKWSLIDIISSFCLVIHNDHLGVDDSLPKHVHFSRANYDANLGKRSGDAKAAAATSASTAIDEETTKKWIAEGKHLITQRYIEVTLVDYCILGRPVVEKYLMQMIKLGFHRSLC